MINLTIMWITLRALFGRRRFLLLLPLPLVLVVLAVGAWAAGAAPHEWAEPVLLGLGMALVLPVTALIVGASVLGAEIDDGTVLHILAKPLPRREIVLSKLLVAVVATALPVGAAMLVAGTAAGSARLALGLLLATVAGALVYCALFVMLSLVSRRPVLIGLVYIVLWEGLLGNLAPGARVLSIQQYTVTIADLVADTPLFAGSVSAPVALGLASVITIGAVLLAIDRLRSFSLVGDRG